MHLTVARTLRGGTHLRWVILALAASSSILLAESRITAILSAAGRVAVNGSGIPATTVLVSGDRIETAADGSATLSLPGSTVVIPANSNVLFRNELLHIQRGTASVNTTRGLRAKVEPYLVSPLGKQAARFQVSKRNDVIVIAAEQGTLLLEGAETTTLGAGNTAMFTAHSGPVISKTSTNTGKILAGAGASGGATAAAMAVSTGRKAEDASPSHP